MAEPERGLLREALGEAVARLPDGRDLAVVQIGKSEIFLWKVYRDSLGVPRTKRRTVLRAPGEAGQPLEGIVYDILDNVQESQALFSVEDSAPGSAPWKVLDGVRRSGAALRDFTCPAPFVDLLREVLAEDPLTRMYELVTLRRTSGGGAEMQTTPLFPVGAQRGETTPLTLRFVSGPPGPPALALVASAQHTQAFGLLSVLSGPVGSGVHTVTAELVRPGRVRFEGLPAPLAEDPRSWNELVSCLPERLEPARPRTGHLVCAVETSVPAADPERLKERIARVRQLLAGLADAPDAPRVSLLSYGSHRFAWGVPEQEPPVWCWEGGPEDVLERLDRLAARGPQTESPQRAAEVECALAVIGDRLERSDGTGRTTLLFVGERSPFPRRNQVSGLLPCPRRRDWRLLAGDLRERLGAGFAAICDDHDEEDPPEFWTEFSDGPLFGLDAVDLGALRAALGLSTSARGLPFPLVETE